MKATVGKQFQFNAAHNLPGHDSPCANVHGHTYTVEIICRGEVGEQERGMVVDFGELKRAFNKEVHDKLDHTNLSDALEYPTTENVAAMILLRVGALVPNVRAVKVWEGPKQYAEVSVD